MYICANFQIFQSCASLPQNIYPVDASAQTFPYAFQSQQGSNLQSYMMPNGTKSQSLMNSLTATIRRNPGTQQPPNDGYNTGVASQVIHMCSTLSRSQSAKCPSIEYKDYMHTYDDVLFFMFRFLHIGMMTSKMLCRWDLARINNKTFMVSIIFICTITII